ncbi:MAG: hypothetical protein RIQ56_368, partial [Candidatus Parcubacteria bacterium]
EVIVENNHQSQLSISSSEFSMYRERKKVPRGKSESAA